MTVEPISLPTSLRLSFNIGQAYPADSVVAVFVSAFGMALNDLVMVNKLYLGKEDDPALVPQRLYLVRLSASHLYEVRNTVNLAHRYETVRAFLDRLPAATQHDLEMMMHFDIDWIERAANYIRNSTFHYGSRPDDLQKLHWALNVTAEMDGEIDLLGPTAGDRRLRFADSITNQQLIRKCPEYEQEPSGDVDDETLQIRTGELFRELSAATSAAIRFLAAAVDAYVQQLPDGIVTSTTIDRRTRRSRRSGPRPA